jgi:hypothetical protein
MKIMKRLLVILTILCGILSCNKDNKDEEKAKLTLACQLDNCQDLSFSIGGETGSSRTYSLDTHYTYASGSQLEKATSTGTVTYNDTGHVYQINAVVYFLTCKYTLTITDQNGVKGSCGN